MTAGLETFAKVRAVHDRTTSPGEKASAAARMQTLARKAGMSVEQAVSKLDAPQPKTQAAFMADAMNEFFNRPEFVAERVERERKRAIRAAEIIARHGSEDAVFADTPMEAALRAACEPLLGPDETWQTIYHLDGWGSLASRSKMPASVREAVTRAWPMPETVAAAWAEYEASDRLTGERCTVDFYHDPHLFSAARQDLVEAFLNVTPARGLNDLRARGAWLDFWANREVEQTAEDHRTVIATLRDDIERMGRRLREQGTETATDPLKEGQCDRGDEIDAAPSVQGGQGKGYAQSADPSLNPCWATVENSTEGGSHSAHPSCPPGPSREGRETLPPSVQSGQVEGGPHTGHPKGSAQYAHPSRRTNADKRRDVLALLGQGLADREIARRAGVSPTTVGTIRRSAA